MECPICMEMYDEERTPMKAFCRCRQTLCLPCLQHILSNGSQCPWDRTRWIGRNIMKKFQDATPTGLLETLRSSSTEGDANFDVITQDLLANSAFADQQYAMFLLLEEERHQAKRQYQERQDAEFAKQLLAQEVQRRLQSSKAVEKATKPNKPIASSSGSVGKAGGGTIVSFLRPKDSLIFSKPILPERVSPNDPIGIIDKKIESSKASLASATGHTTLRSTASKRTNESRSLTSAFSHSSSSNGTTTTLSSSSSMFPSSSSASILHGLKHPSHAESTFKQKPTAIKATPKTVALEVDFVTDDVEEDIIDLTQSDFAHDLPTSSSIYSSSSSSSSSSLSIAHPHHNSRPPSSSSSSTAFSQQNSSLHRHKVYALLQHQSLQRIQHENGDRGVHRYVDEDCADDVHDHDDDEYEESEDESVTKKRRPRPRRDVIFKRRRRLPSAFGHALDSSESESDDVVACR